MYQHPERSGCLPRLLIADDDEDLRGIVAWLLRSSGYRVVTARDGCEALEKLAAGDISLVVLDLHMPRLGGLGVLQAMTRDERLRRIPVVVMTACPSQAPADAVVLAKPFDADRLIGLVDRLLQRDRQLDAGERALALGAAVPG